MSDVNGLGRGRAAFYYKLPHLSQQRAGQQELRDLNSHLAPRCRTLRQ